MKKIFLLLTILTIFTTCLFSQSKTLLFRETFDGPDLPQGWERVNWPANRIVIDKKSLAGGEPNELSFVYTYHYAEVIGCAVTPVIDLSNATGTIMIEFLGNIRNVESPCTMGVATTSDNGATWNLVWVKEFEGTTDAFNGEKFSVLEELESPDIGSNFRLSFFFYSECRPKRPDNTGHRCKK